MRFRLEKFHLLMESIMHHIILKRTNKNIDYNNLYIPDTQNHIIVPVLRKVYDKLPHRAMYLDEFLKWRKKYYKE